MARLDRLSRSFVGFAQILEFWLKHKIKHAPVRHAGRRLRSRQPHVRDDDRHPDRLRQLRAAADQRRGPARGSRPASSGARSIAAGPSTAGAGRSGSTRRSGKTGQRQGRRTSGERAILRKVVELRAAGHISRPDPAAPQLRDEGPHTHGRPWTTSRIAFLVQQGLRLMAETEGDDPDEILPSADAEEE